jgi:hypothetical protein
VSPAPQAQIEASIDALIAKLTAELPAKLVAINEANGDQFVLEDPQGITFGQRSEVPYPWVAVLPETSENLAEASGRIHFEHGIATVCWLADGDEESLIRKLTRYQQAVREVAVHFRRPGASPVSDDPGGYWLGYVRDIYGPVFEGGPAGAFVSWARTTFSVKQQQDL